MVAFRLDGCEVSVEDDDGSLLDALRERLGRRSVKDGCSPQGQCGCCTVWVDGAPRVACVTPVRRVAGRSVTTVDGLDPAVRGRWVDAFVRAGASQCGFCTPGILMRLVALEQRGRGPDEGAVRSALLAHLCRCTGWQSIVEAAALAMEPAAAAVEPRNAPTPAAAPPAARGEDRHAWRCERRAAIEGAARQRWGPDVVLGGGGFADDTAPPDALVVLGSGAPSRVPAPSLVEARRSSGKVQGRNSTAALRHPVPLPEGDWALTLRTTWVEPAYLEPDASWCRPGDPAASPLANGGAFGGKRHSPVVGAAESLAAEHGRPVRVLWSREDVVRNGPKRPPVAVGVRADGSGVMRVGVTPGSPDLSAVHERVAAVAPSLAVELVEVAGPPVALDLRGAAWAEAAAVLAALGAASAGQTGPGTEVEVVGPSGGRARVAVADHEVRAEVWAGEVLDATVLRSYCYGAVHQALGWVWREGIAVDEPGNVEDLTIRSFGILTARETPSIVVTVHPEAGPPVNGSDAVFAATSAAAWLAEGLPGEWPTRRARAGLRPALAGSQPLPRLVGGTP